MFRIAVLTAFLTAPLVAGPDDYVEWKPVPGSSGYQVQVRETKTKKILVDKTVQGTMLDVDLAPGLYQSRVAPLSPFGRPLQWSDWRPLNVLISLRPEFNEQPRVVIEGSRPTTVVITGRNFTRSMRLTLRNESGSHPILDRRVNEAGTEVQFSIQPGRYPEGEYDLHLENPRQKNSVIPAFVSVRVPQNLALLDGKNQPGKDSGTADGNPGRKDDKTDPGKNRPDTQPGNGDYREQLRNMPSTCKGSGLPDVLIKHCYKYHLVLDLSTQDKTDLHQYLLAYQGNYAERMTGYNYFRSGCTPLGGQVRVFLEERLEMSRESLEAGERADIERTIESLKQCHASANP